MDLDRVGPGDGKKEREIPLSTSIGVEMNALGSPFINHVAKGNFSGRHTSSDLLQDLLHHGRVSSVW
jgi:anthranilate phosphoribosyltransferase